MQFVYLSLLLATVGSVFCAPDSTLLSNIIENSGEPLSDSDSSSNDLPIPTMKTASPPPPSFSSEPADETSTATPAEPCAVPPCNSLIVIQMEDPHANRTDVQKSVDEAFGDRVVRWLVVSKTTHIDRTEETSDDFMTGKKKKVSSENRLEQLQVLQDNKHSFFGNEFDLVSVFQ